MVALANISSKRLQACLDYFAAKVINRQQKNMKFIIKSLFLACFVSLYLPTHNWHTTGLLILILVDIRCYISRSSEAGKKLVKVVSIIETQLLLVDDMMNDTT